MPKKGYNYPIKIKIALAKRYSVGLEISLYHQQGKKSIPFCKKMEHATKEKRARSPERIKTFAQ